MRLGILGPGCVSTWIPLNWLQGRPFVWNEGFVWNLYVEATVIWDSCMQIHSLLRTGLFFSRCVSSDFVQVISSDHDAVDEIESWRQMVGLEELQAWLLWPNTMGGHVPTLRRHLRGVLLRWTRMCLMRLENGWYRILSFEGCNNEVRFGLDCSIIGVRHWCKNFSFTVILSIGLPRRVPKGFAWKHHHYCIINSSCSWLHVSIAVECCIFSLFIFHCCNSFIIFLRLCLSYYR